MLALVVLALILVGGVLTCFEMALFSVRRERLQLDLQRGDRRADLALKFLDEPPRFLTGTQVVATLVGILTGALGQAWLTEPFAEWWRQVVPDALHVEGAGFWLMVVALTFVTLVLGNLLPKQIGFVWAERVTLAAMPFARAYLWLVAPVSWAVEAAVRGLARLFAVPIAARAEVSEGDVLLLMEEGENCGLLDRSEHEIAVNAFRLSDVLVSEHMTPRDAILWVDLLDPIDDIDDRVRASDVSFLLVCEGGLDQVVGVLKSRSYLLFEKQPDKRAIRDILLPAVSVRESARLLDVLEALRQSYGRLVVVRDAGRRVLGLLSLNDVVSLIVGPIRSVAD